MFNSTFDELKEVQYFKGMTDFISFIKLKMFEVKAEAYLEPNRASMM